MKPAVAFLFGFCLMQAAHAQGNRAVSETNGEGTLQYTEGGTIAATANLNVPLADVFGLTLGANLIEDSDFDGFGYFAGLFVRDYTVGHAGLTVKFDELKADSGRDIDVETLDLRGALYLGNADIYASYSTVDIDPGPAGDLDLAYVGAAFYLDPDIRLFGALGFEDAEDSYTVGFEVQPAIFDQQASVRFDYTDGDGTDSIVSAAFRYYFASPKSLQKRFREDIFP